MRPTLRLVLTAAKCLGLISFSYTATADELLTRDAPSTADRTFLEFARTFLLVAFTYHHFHSSVSHVLLQWTFLFKVWVPLVASRTSETQMIRLINGIVKLDHIKSITFCRRRLNETRWLAIFGTTAAYIVVYHVILTYAWPPKTTESYTVTKFLFGPPFFIDLVIVVSACFYLGHIDCAFQTLINVCDELQDQLLQRTVTRIFFSPGLESGLESVELAGISKQQSSIQDTATLFERIRLQHVKLSRLLETFDACYGPQLLSFFVFSFADSLFYFFWTICMKLPRSAGVRPAQDVLRPFAQLVLFGQNVFLITTVVIAAYRVDQKVKMLMNQVSDLEVDKITAFGFFNINPKLIVSILILLTTGIATLIQMKEHQFIQQFVNVTAIYVTHITDIN